MSNISDVATALNLLNEIVLASYTNIVVFVDQRRETGSLDGFEAESLDKLVLGGESFTGDSYHADVDAADELAHNEVVDGEAGVVCVVVVLATVLGF